MVLPVPLRELKHPGRFFFKGLNLGWEGGE